MPKLLLLTPAGHLEILGHLSTSQPASIARYEGGESTERDIDLRSLQWVCGPGITADRRFRYLYVDGSHGQTMLGLARFDDDTTTECTHAWLVVKVSDSGMRSHLLVRNHRASIAG
jgi:hypothetical protein